MDVVVYDSLGAQEDTASSTGSLHAKVKDVRNLIQKPRGLAGPVASLQTDNQAYQTALSVNGKGKLIGVWATCTQSAGEFRVRITLDGVVVTSSGSVTDMVKIYYPLPTCLSVNDDSAEGWSLEASLRNLELEFKTSIKIEVRSPKGNPYYATVHYLYTIE